MADSHPYISGAGNITQIVNQLRSSFPNTVTSETVKRLGIAPNNESYVINALQYVGVIDGDGKKTDEAAHVFSHHNGEEFANAFQVLVKKAYFNLFDLHGENSWTLDDDTLITFFRQIDQTSATIGRRQASTFKVFSALSGHSELPAPRTGKAKISVKVQEQNGVAKSKTVPKSNKANKASGTSAPRPEPSGEPNFGLTVNVVINLPPDVSKEMYDNFFRSIKDNLLDG